MRTPDEVAAMLELIPARVTLDLARGGLFRSAPELSGVDAMRGKRLVIRGDVPAAELRRLARREPSRATAARLLAVANALEGMTRAEAARLVGLERQALRDAVLRYNAEGAAGLRDRPRSGRPPRLDETALKGLRELVLTGPDVEADGLSAWTLAELCREVEERWKVTYHPSHMGKVLRRLGLSRQKARPTHPKADAKARDKFAKGGSPMPWRRRAGPTPASA